ncbi:MAG: NADH-quinone oxidoreductase subunit N, partial [Helicobacteraceae bacterium]|nr:NADH-quinone oxidoreductase subunit N [Helicobacteraceae bacterium]
IYYYLKLIVYMFLRDPSDNDGTIYYQNSALALKIVLGIAAVMVIFSFAWIEPALSTLGRLMESAGY